MLKKSKAKCLFINVYRSFDKLLSSSNIKSKFDIVLYEDINQPNISLSNYVKEHNISRIIFENSRSREIQKNEVIDLIELRLLGVKIHEAEDFYESVNKRVPIIKTQDYHYFSDEIFSLKRKRASIFYKRLFDITFSLLAFPFAFPLFIVGGVLTSLTSKGGMFYVQRRIGRKGKEFKIFKIRTMTQDNGDNTNKITPLGRILRYTKIDELPQFYNILKGDMSLIGPRPEQARYVEQYSQENPFFNLRHMIRPGVSGWAQINLPKATPEDNLKKLEYDLYYIKNYSWKLDLKIIFNTIKIILTLNSN